MTLRMMPQRIVPSIIMGVLCLGLTAAPAMAQRIANPSPPINGMDVEPDSAISASFSSIAGISVRPETVQITVDGQDVTAQSVITSDFFSYRPRTPFSPGRHEVRLQYTNTNERTRQAGWSFTVGNPVPLEITAVNHNAANRSLAVGESLLITVTGTSGSDVTVFLVQDQGQQLRSFPTLEVSPGIYIVNERVDTQDSTQEGIVVARLARQDQVRFATAEQPVRLVDGATGSPQVVSDESTDTEAQILPQVTNYSDGDIVTEQTFTVEAITVPNASVEVSVTAANSLGGVISAQRSLFDQTIQADAQGNLQFTVRPSFPASGTTYTITMASTANGQTSPTVTLRLIQE